MKQRTRLALILLTLLTVVLTGFSGGEKPRKATWIWNTSLIAAEPEQILSFFNKQGVSVLYLNIDTSKPASYYQPFIGKAQAAGIEVHALGGHPSWALEQNRDRLLALLDWVHTYNQHAAETEKLSGIHLDIEPYLLPAWNTDREQVVRQWMSSVEAYVKHSKTVPSLQVSCDMPFWLDEIPLPDHPAATLSDWLIGQHDHVTIMAYRDQVTGPNSITSLVQQEMSAADGLNKQVFIAVETNQSKEGAFVTFHEEGEAFMHGQLNQLPALMSSHPSFAGIAVHSYESWKAMKG